MFSRFFLFLCLFRQLYSHRISCRVFFGVRLHRHPIREMNINGNSCIVLSMLNPDLQFGERMMPYYVQELKNRAFQKRSIPKGKKQLRISTIIRRTFNKIRVERIL